MALFYDQFVNNTATPVNTGITNPMSNMNAIGSGGTFNIPTNLFPYSNSLGFNTGTSSGSGRSQSGINWQAPIMNSLLPQLNQSVEQLPGLLGSLSETLQGQYGNMIRQALSPQAFQGTLNQLSNRNVLNSGIASDAMADVAKSITSDIADRGYQSMLAQLLAQTELPGILAQIAELARQSSASQSSGSNQMGFNTNYSANPLAPYSLMTGLLTY